MSPRLLLPLLWAALAFAPPGGAGAEPPGFPVLPPIPTADPAVRKEKEFRLPTRLQVKRTEDQLAVALDPDSAKPVKVEVGKDMVTGLKRELVVSRDGKRVVSGYASLENGPAATGWADSGVTLNRAVDKVPRPGEKYTVEVRVTLFETDIPTQHLWMPETGKYKVLWTKTVKQEVE